MCLCSSRGHDHHGTALVLPRLSFRAKSSCLKQYIIMSNAWRLGDVKVSCIVAHDAICMILEAIYHVRPEFSYEPIFPKGFISTFHFLLMLLLLIPGFANMLVFTWILIMYSKPSSELSLGCHGFPNVQREYVWLDLVLTLYCHLPKYYYYLGHIVFRCLIASF